MDEEEASRPRTQEAQHERMQSGPHSYEENVSSMRARTWTVASLYSEPEEYGIPKLPEWAVHRTDGCGVAFAEVGETEPFISAEEPMRVRR